MLRSCCRAVVVVAVAAAADAAACVRRAVEADASPCRVARKPKFFGGQRHDVQIKELKAPMTVNAGHAARTRASETKRNNNCRAVSSSRRPRAPRLPPGEWSSWRRRRCLHYSSGLGQPPEALLGDYVGFFFALRVCLLVSAYIDV